MPWYDRSSNTPASLGLPAYQFTSRTRSRVHKRARRTVFPALSYRDAIVAANSTRLKVRREELCKKVWEGICVPGSRLHHLIPPKRADCHAYELRNKNHVSLFKCRTQRFKKSFFPAMESNAQSL